MYVHTYVGIDFQVLFIALNLRTYADSAIKVIINY